MCKACVSKAINREQAVARTIAWRQANPERAKATRNAKRKEIASSLTTATAELVLRAREALLAAVEALNALVATIDPAAPRHRKKAEAAAHSTPAAPVSKAPALPVDKPPPIRTIKAIIAEDKVTPGAAKRIQDGEILARADWKPPPKAR